MRLALNAVTPLMASIPLIPCWNRGKRCQYLQPAATAPGVHLRHRQPQTYYVAISRADSGMDCRLDPRNQATLQPGCGDGMLRPIPVTLRPGCDSSRGRGFTGSGISPPAKGAATLAPEWEWRAPGLALPTTASVPRLSGPDIRRLTKESHPTRETLRARPRGRTPKGHREACARSTAAPGFQKLRSPRPRRLGGR